MLPSQALSHLSSAGFSAPPRGQQAAFFLALFASVFLNSGRAAAQDDRQSPAKRTGTVPPTDLSRDDVVGARRVRRGVCRDEAGKPLAGAKIRVFVIEPTPLDSVEHREIARAEADDAGKFAIDLTSVLPSGGAVPTLFIVQAAGLATFEAQIVVDDPNRPQYEGEETTEFVLSRAAILRGRVTASDGKPVAGALVACPPGLSPPVAGIRAARTDADGVYEITDLMSDNLNQKRAAGQRVVQFTSYVEAEGFATQRFGYRQVPGTTDVVLQPAAVVNGQVLIGKRGQPAKGARIKFSNDAVPHDESTQAISDSGGRFNLSSLPPGEYTVAAHFADYPSVYLENVKLVAGKNPLELCFDIGGTIRGRVIDVTTGKPVVLGAGSGITVRRFAYIDGQGIGLDQASVMDDGTFTLRAPTGRTRLSISFRRTGWEIVDRNKLSQGIDVSQAEDVEVEVRVRPARAPVVVNGLPLDAAPQRAN